MTDLETLNRRLACYDNLDRFGGRYRFVCTGLYRVAFRLVLSILNDHGDIQTSRTEHQLFTACATHHPDRGEDLQDLVGLRAFRDRGLPDPFDPVGEDARVRVVRLRNATIRLLHLAYDVRALARQRPDVTLPPNTVERDPQ